MTERRDSCSCRASLNTPCPRSKGMSEKNVHRGGNAKQRSREYFSWSAMVRRCTDPNYVKYPRYGGIGIAICERWLQFSNFMADMGPRPPGTSLDRFPNRKGNYEPGNCRWATPVEQNSNTSKNVLLTFGCETHTVAEWARQLGLTRQSLHFRINNGWSVADALTTPSKTAQQ